MRTHHVVISISLAAALAACNRQDAPTTTQSAPSHATPAADLAVAPRPYERMRFVSPMEQSKREARLRSPSRSRRVTASFASHEASRATRGALTSLAARPTAPMTIAATSVATPTIAVAAVPAAPPMAMPMAAMPEMIGDHGRGDRSEGPRVVIRGGMAPNGKCDPRSDAQAAGMLAGRPNSSMPLMPSSSVFGRR